MATKKASKKKQTQVIDEPVEPLSNFQETEKTGRVDPSQNGHEKQKLKSALTIEKVKMVKNDYLKVDFSKIEPDATTSSDSYENKMRPVHPDCRAAFKNLSVHLGLLCDYLSTRQIKEIDKYDQELVEAFHVTGISIGGGDGEEGIVLTGHKITKSGKAVILNSPFTRFEEDEKTVYRHVDNLRTRVDAVIQEAKLYLEGKRGEEAQQKLEFPEKENEESLVEEAL
jgi:hypothetical protein